MKTLISFVSILFFSNTLWADYLTATLPAKQPSQKTSTYVLIVGKGLEVGDQFLKAAHTQALVYQEKVPTASIFMVAGIDYSTASKFVKDWGYTNVKVKNEVYTADRLIAALKGVSRIAGIDLYGHNGALRGFALENYDTRLFTANMKSLATAIAGKMESGAIIRAYGCNTGYYLAPQLAEALNVPVLGTYTYADTQQILDDQLWYYNDKGRYPDGHSFIFTNSLSFEKPVQCLHGGGCLRLKTVTNQYQGKHGKYGGTVPFTKVHCGKISAKNCADRLAKSTMTLIASAPIKGFADQKPSLEDFSSRMVDQFCGSWIDLKKRDRCSADVMAHLQGTKALSPTYTVSSVPTLDCDLKTCSFRKNCSSGTCVLESAIDKASKTFVNELNFYKLGFDNW